MKKYIATFLAILMGLSLLTGCSNSSPSSATSAPSSAATTETNDSSGSEDPITIGYSTIYMSPTWQQTTYAKAEERFNYWKEQGVVDELIQANANGDTATQISQIENFISQGVDAIVVIAGSATALNPVLEKAEEQGIRVIATDGLPDTDKITCKICPSDIEVGKKYARWLVEQLDGKGDIIVFNGPAGISCSELRREGAMEVLAEYPDINVVTEVNAEYNAGPAKQAILPVLTANPDIDGVLALSGVQGLASLSVMLEKGMDPVPVPGDNYNAFLRTWSEAKEIDPSFESMGIVHPNWMGAMTIDAAIRAVRGYELPKFVEIDSVMITEDTLGDFVPNDEPDDCFLEPDITEEDYVKYLGAMD